MIYLIFLEKQNHVSYRLYKIHENIKERANTQRHNNHPKKGFRRLFIGDLCGLQLYAEHLDDLWLR